jgi:hypothetical protein
MVSSFLSFLPQAFKLRLKIVPELPRPFLWSLAAVMGLLAPIVDPAEAIIPDYPSVNALRPLQASFLQDIILKYFPFSVDKGVIALFVS